jgi:hypothetical protein
VPTETLSPNKIAESKSFKHRAKKIGKAVAWAALLPAGVDAGEAVEDAWGMYPGHEAAMVQLHDMYQHAEVAPNAHPKKASTAEANPAAPYYMPNVPNSQEATADKWGHCEVADVQLQSYPSLAEALKGAETPMAITAERYSEAVMQLSNVHTREEAQSIMATALAGTNLKIRFDGDYTIYETVEPAPPDSPDSIKTYADGMVRLLHGFAQLPQAMLDGQTVSINNTRSWKESGDDRNAVGTYDAGEKRIELAALGADNESVIHEFSHWAHEEACRNYSDEEMKAVYDQAMKYLEEIDNDPALRDEYISEEMRALIGPPSGYSEYNYKELMAEMSTKLLTRGYTNLKTELPTGAVIPENSVIHHLEELSAERLQDAMKKQGIEIAAYLTYVSVYGEGFQLGDIDPQDIAKNKVSPLDKTFNRDHFDGKGTALTPAVEVNTGDAKTYIYASRYQDSISIQFGWTNNKEADEEIMQAAKRYMNAEARKMGGEENGVKQYKNINRFFGQLTIENSRS